MSIVGVNKGSDGDVDSDNVNNNNENSVNKLVHNLEMGYNSNVNIVDDVCKSVTMCVNACWHKKSGIKDRSFIYCDTQAEGSITPDRELIGMLDNNIAYYIDGWNGPQGNRTPSYSGVNNILGSFIYTSEASCTLYAYWDLLLKFDVMWSRDGRSFCASHKTHRNIELQFGFPENNISGNKRVLVADVSEFMALFHSASQQTVSVMKFQLWKELPFACSQASYKCATEVLRFHSFVHPGDKATEDFCYNQALLNIPFSRGDVRTAIQIRNGPCPCCAISKATKKSRNRKKRSSSVEKDNLLEQPPVTEELLDPHLKHETVGFDCFFINKRRYLLGVGKHGSLLSVVHVQDGTKKTIGKAMHDIIMAYRRNRTEVVSAYNHGALTPPDYSAEDDDTVAPILIVGEVISDGELAIINSGLELLPSYGIQVTPLAAGEHVGFAERPIRTIKERVAAVQASLSYQLDDILEPWLVVHVVNWLNLMPKTGRALSAFTMHTRRRLAYKDVTRVAFGAFVVATRVEKQRVANNTRGELCVALGSNLNTPGSYFVYSVDTKQIKLRKRFEVLSTIDGASIFGANRYAAAMPTYGRHVGKYNESLVQRYAEPYSSGQSIYSPIVITDKDDEGAHPQLEHDDSIFRTPSSVNPGTQADVMMDATPEQAAEPLPDIKLEGGAEVTEAQDVKQNLHSVFDEIMDDDRETAPGLADPVIELPPSTVATNELFVVGDTLGSDTVDHVKSENNQTNEPVDTNPGRRSKRDRRVNYRSLAGLKNRRANMAQIHETEGLVEENVSVNSISFKKGVQTYGNRAEVAIEKELHQIVNEYNVFTPVNHSYKDVRYMRTHDLIDEKLDGTVKARYVVGKQVGEEDDIEWGIDIFSPTIDMKLVMLMLSICLEEDLDLEVWDIKGAFLKAVMANKGIFVRIESFIAAKIIKLRPEWKSFIRPDGSMLVELNKAWYGTAAASALWHKDIKETLTGPCGYTQHPKVPCLFFRKLEGGRKGYIMLHVDDLGVMMPRNGVERDRVKGILTGVYEEMRIQTGDSVTYIGIECTRNREENRFYLGMTKRIMKFCEKWKVDKSVPYPYKGDLLNKEKKTNSSPLLDKAGVTAYRSLVMSMRYLGMTVKPEILWLCSYLSTKQCSPTQVDYDAGIHCMRYLYGVKDEMMRLGPIGVSPIIRVYADSSHQIYSDLTGHGGTVIYVGMSSCPVFFCSGKIKVHCKSSTDAEIIEFEKSTYLGNYFHIVLKDMGIESTIVYMQDNDSALAWGDNGNHDWDSKRKHILSAIMSVNLYLSESPEASTMACITEYMLADIMTKPLTGVTWKFQKAFLYGIPFEDKQLEGVLLSKYSKVIPGPLAVSVGTSRSK